MNQTIDSLIDGMVSVFQSSGYIERSVQVKVHILHTIAKMHRQKGFDELNNEVITFFLDTAYARYQSGEIGRVWYLNLVKTVDYLRQYAANNTLNMINRNIPSGLSMYWNDILQAMEDYPDWNEKTPRNIRKYALTYVKWLQSQGHETFESVDTAVIRAYLMDCGERMVPRSLDTVKRCIKKFHRFLAAIGKTSEDFQAVFSFTVPIEHKVKKPAGEIVVIQSKTNQPVALPLTTDVGQAIQDYILNGRPQSTLPNVFLRSKSPFLQMGQSMPYQIYNGYRQKLGLPKGSFHGLRRAVGTNMVISGVPVTTVAQVLGHSSIEPTKQYISLDGVHLKECALSLAAIPMKPGGAR